MSDLHIELTNMGRDLRDAQANLNQVFAMSLDRLNRDDSARLDKAIGMVQTVAKRLEQLTTPVMEGAA